MNVQTLQSLTRGQYGRKIAYANVSEITVDNIVQVIGKCIGVFYNNRPIIKYLWDYYKGDQPILYRSKLVRDDIVNKVVENHAYEIVQFGVSQTYGEPIQYVSRSKDEAINKAVDEFNDYMYNAFKYQRNVMQGEWKTATGTSFLAIQRTGDSETPFRITVPTPLDTFIIYSSYTDEPLLAVQELKDSDGELYKLCFSQNMEFIIKNGKLVEGSARPHAFGGIPIVEIPNNQNRISDIEIVISLLDSINNMQSNRMDAIEQFVQSWVKFINCEIDVDNFNQMKMAGALVVKSPNGLETKADVDIMTQELNQTESQVAKDDLWNNALSILAIPNKQGNTGGDTQGAVELRNGWDFSKGRAKLKDSYVIEAEKRFAKVALNVIRIAGNNLNLESADFSVNITHSPTDNLYTKTQALAQMLTSGIHPLVATTTCGLWGDSEKVYLQSKPYLDAKYKTADALALEEENIVS